MHVSGTVVDLMNYSLDRRNNSVDSYRALQERSPRVQFPGSCKESARRGFPIGLREHHCPGGNGSTGERLPNTFVLLVHAPSLAEYIGKSVRVEGRLAGADIAGGGVLIVEKLFVVEEASAQSGDAGTNRASPWTRVI